MRATSTRFADPNVAPEFIVPQADVIDLTGKMQPDGTLDWTPPAGNVDGSAHRLLAHRP